MRGSPPKVRRGPPANHRHYNNILDPSFSNSNIIKSHSSFMFLFQIRNGLGFSSAKAPLDCAVSVLLGALGVVSMV